MSDREANLNIQKDLHQQQEDVIAWIEQCEYTISEFKIKMAAIIKMKDEAFVKISQLRYELKEFKEKVATDQKCNGNFQL